jgi:hypothetical protein
MSVSPLSPRRRHHHHCHHRHHHHHHPLSLILFPSSSCPHLHPLSLILFPSSSSSFLPQWAEVEALGYANTVAAIAEWKAMVDALSPSEGGDAINGHVGGARSNGNLNGHIDRLKSVIGVGHIVHAYTQCPSPCKPPLHTLICPLRLPLDLFGRYLF